MYPVPNVPYLSLQDREIILIMCKSCFFVFYYSTAKLNQYKLDYKDLELMHTIFIKSYVTREKEYI